MVDEQRANRGGVLRVLGMGIAMVGVILGAPAMASEPDPAMAERHLATWQIADARASLEVVEASGVESPYIDYLRGRYAFYTGDYDEAQTLLARATEGESNERWEQLQTLVEQTRSVVDGYKRHESESGRFVMYVEPGPDEVLVPFAFEALELAYDAIGEELGHYPDEPVRVEVYPSESVLADVSLLTEENIRNSGTIALCQYNRLMITSPRALLRGYTWVDTLVHEYIHLVINQRTTEEVPIWMHEGLAKFLERRWRGEDAHRLDGTAEQILERRLDEGNLVEFEDMNPSMALLPTREDTAVAFAQVYTTMEYLRQELGSGAFEALLDAINEGYESREAYARVLGTEWDRFENYTWRNYLHRRQASAMPEDEEQAFEDELVFEDEATSDLDQVEDEEAKAYMQLGQMLEVRGRYRAAAVQYQKAEDEMGDENPMLQGRLAKTLTLGGDPESAVAALERVRELHPGVVTIWLELGRAKVELGRYEQAREVLHEAARLNPFNPEIHEMLVDVYDELGEHDDSQRARHFRDLVRS